MLIHMLKDKTQTKSQVLKNKFQVLVKVVKSYIVVSVCMLGHGGVVARLKITPSTST